MDTRLRRIGLGVLGLLFLAGSVCTARVVPARPHWNWHHNSPPPPPNRSGTQNTNSTAADSALKRFKELPLNTKFYMATDRMGNFLKMKVSAEGARDVGKAGELGALNSPIPGDTQVVVKETGQTAASTKKTAAKKKP